jgi:hypothetical protein
VPVTRSIKDRDLQIEFGAVRLDQGSLIAAAGEAMKEKRFLFSGAEKFVTETIATSENMLCG